MPSHEVRDIIMGEAADRRQMALAQLVQGHMCPKTRIDGHTQNIFGLHGGPQLSAKTPAIIPRRRLLVAMGTAEPQL